MLLSHSADLHTHTTASDGLDEPATLLQRAHSLGLGAIAITDHDTVDAHQWLLHQVSPLVTVVPGVEMSANVGTAEVHILGYFVDPSSSYLNEALARLRQQRLRRVERFCARLTSIGVPITFGEVLAYATGETIGRPHIARAMIKRGYVASVSEAFDRYLSGGRPGFVPRDDVTPEFSIDLIHRSGGAAVLAHPYTTGDPDRTLSRLTAVGLDGVEVEYGAYNEEQRWYLRELATTRSLIATGGSDYHGSAHREDTPLGAGTVDLTVVERLYERSNQYQ